MAEDRIVKLCARLDARSISLVMMTNCPVVKVTFLANKCQYLENGARLVCTYNGWLIGNSKWPIKWQQRQWLWMTLKVIRQLHVFSDAIRRTFVQHFTRFQLTVCSHVFSALAQLLVFYLRTKFGKKNFRDGEGDPSCTRPQHGINTSPPTKFTPQC